MLRPIKTKSKSTVSGLTQKLVKVFNAYIRERDKNKPCISCGSFTDLQAGHFYPAGHYTSLRFNEQNVAGQCVRCNYFLSGNQNEYRKGLIQRIGIEEVEKLDMLSGIKKVRKYSRFELELLIEYYKEKIKLIKTNK